MRTGKLSRLGGGAFGVLAGGALLLSPSAFAGEGMSVADKFAAMDTNHDGKVSPDEHQVGAKMMFDKMDANHDGEVTASEMETAHIGKAKGMTAAEKIKVVDNNGDGMISVDEYYAGARAIFNKMDSDQDGYLTKSEMEAGHKKMMEKK
jgi:Ca2+-binding EF-hand superfamily protein